MLPDQYTVTQGSGLFPHHQTSPAVDAFGDIPDNTYPVPCKGDMRTRSGDGAVVLNPEDFSIQLGLRSQAITVDLTAIPLPSDPLIYRRALVVHNAGPDTVYIGASGVTASDGLPLLINEKIAIDIQGHQNVTVYAVASSSGQDVRIMELS